MNSSGQLESREFFFVYRTLCLKMGVSPPSSLQEVQQAAIEADNNGNGSISKMELFTLFKKMQLNAGKGINMGGMGSTGGMGGMGGMGGVAPQQRIPLLIQLSCKVTHSTGGPSLTTTIRLSKDSQLSTTPEDGMLTCTTNF